MSDVSGCCGGECKATPAAPGTSVALSTLLAGQTGTVRQTTLEPRDAALLRAMGLRPNARIRVCRLGEPCIVEVLSGTRLAGCGDLAPSEGCCCRIGLARPLAERVMIEMSSHTSPVAGE